MVGRVGATVEAASRCGENVRKLYSLAVPREVGEPPHVRLVGYLVADYGESLQHGRETNVFPCNHVGEVLDWEPLCTLRFDGVSDDWAMALLGYEVGR